MTNPPERAIARPLDLVMLEKEALSAAQQAMIKERLALPVHLDDEGPSRVWHTESPNLYAFFQIASGRLVALVTASGVEEARPGWWVDSEFRGRGYGAQVVDLLAERLKARGVTRIGWILIATRQQRYDQQSGKMVRRLRRHFEG